MFDCAPIPAAHRALLRYNCKFNRVAYSTSRWHIPKRFEAAKSRSRRSMWRNIRLRALVTKSEIH